MTSETLFYFLIFLWCSVSLFWTVIPKKRRPLFLTGLSLAFCALFGVAFLLYFCATLLIVHKISRFLGQDGEKRASILKWSIIWLVTTLCVFKYADPCAALFLGVLAHFVELPTVALPVLALPIGISYFTFRMIHYLVETYRKTLPENSPWDLLLYALFFPTFLSGPIERFKPFHHQIVNLRQLDMADINYGLFRIAAGIFKKFIIADNMARFMMPVLQNPEAYAWGWVLLSVYGLIVRIYMDFSGYTDIAVGVGRLFGFRLPENFNRPLIQKNIALYWRNWHITVYSWIRDYVFFPFFGYRATELKIYAGMFLTIWLFMIWHGASAGYFIAGCYHGLGIVAWQLFQEIKRKRPRLRKLMEMKPVQYMSIGLTFNFVALGVPIYLFDKTGVLNIMGKLFLLNF